MNLLLITYRMTILLLFYKRATTCMLNGNITFWNNVQKAEAAYIHMLTFVFSFAYKALYVIFDLFATAPHTSSLSHINKKLPWITCVLKYWKTMGNRRNLLNSEERWLALSIMCENTFTSSNGSSCVLQISCISIE